MTLRSPAKEKEIRKQNAPKQRNNLMRKLITHDYMELPVTLQLLLNFTNG